MKNGSNNQQCCIYVFVRCNSLLEQMDHSYKDIAFHSVVRWLRCRKVLLQFVSSFGAIKAFLTEK